MARTSFEAAAIPFRRASSQGQIRRLKRQRNLLLLPWAVLFAPVAVPLWLWQRRAATSRGTLSRARTTDGARIDDLARYLWIGAPEQALAALSRIADDPSQPDAVRAAALCQIADRRDFDGDADAAARALDQAGALVPDGAEAREWRLRAAFLALRQRAFHLARHHIDTLDDSPSDMAAALVAASAEVDDTARLDAFNTVLASAGLAPIRLHDPSAPLALTNLACDAAPDPSSTGHVSVIMPAWNAEATIASALRSVLTQTHRDLTVIVVDDASTDGTVAVVERIAAADPRVRLLHQTGNRGAYAARNLGLSVATGDYVTTHDADDWSHPQRIARQLAVLRSRPELAGIMSGWVRMSPDLRVTSGWRLGTSPFSPNFSSFLFRSGLIDEAGPWDPVRFGADSELIARTVARLGTDSVALVDAEVPVAFGLDSPASLTRARTSHVSTFHYGLRQIHAEFSAALHRRGEFTAQAQEMKLQALPGAILGLQRDPVARVLVGDCRNPVVVARMAALIDGMATEGAVTGILHRPEIGAGASAILPGDPFCDAWLDLVLRPGVRAVPPDEVRDVSHRTELIALDS